jgi:hypothetical protein
VKHQESLDIELHHHHHLLNDFDVEFHKQFSGMCYWDIVNFVLLHTSNINI